MAKNNLGQTFVKALVRQVGRDAGKVVSNKAFGDAHATPIRVVQSADTSAQYSGKRRSYRHDLDRVVNGNLPSTVATAKKSIVTLENAYIEFVNNLMPVSNAHEVKVLKNWTNKSLDFVSDVLKIVDKPDVHDLAKDLVSTLSDAKVQIKKGVEAMEFPSDVGLVKNKNIARTVFWVGMALSFLPGLFVDASTDIASSVKSLVGFGVSVVIVGAVLLRRSKKARTEHAKLVSTIQAMKNEAALD